MTVEWTSEESNVHYNINVTPSVPKTFIKNTVNVVQLIVLYNIEYNVSLETVDVCRSKPPSNRQLFYGKVHSYIGRMIKILHHKLCVLHYSSM